MKTFLKVVSVFFCFLLASLSVSAKGYGWYFKSAEGHNRPIVYGGDPMPAKYGSLYLGKPGDKTVYLTFDAGYENGNVEKVLDILKKHNAKAAFFILPNLVRRNTELVLRMGDEGHLVCNHSYSHHDMSQISDYGEFLAEITKNEDVYREMTGREMSEFFRPPEGTFSERMLEFCQIAGVTPVFWSFAYADWNNSSQPDPEKAYEKITENVHDGMVMLLHPTSATNAAVLDRVLTYIEDAGYRFGTLDELAAGCASLNKKYTDSGEVYVTNPEKSKTVALTFDDGPHPTHTDEILGILDSYGIKATFFVIGKNAAEYPEVLKRVAAAGHEIGNHTYSHTLMSRKGEDAMFADAERNRLFLRDTFGIETTLLRPPGGCFSDSAIERAVTLGYKYVLWSWNTDPRDWAGASAQAIVSAVTENLAGGDVILLHDGAPGENHTAEALRILIPKLLAEGYSFDTVSGLFS